MGKPSRNSPFHQFMNDGTCFGANRPAGKSWLKTPTLVPVLSKVPSPVLTWSPRKQPTLLRPVAIGWPAMVTLTSP